MEVAVVMPTLTLGGSEPIERYIEAKANRIVEFEVSVYPNNYITYAEIYL